MVAREEGILQKAQESPECPRGTAPRAAGAALGPAEPGLAQPHKPGGKCSGLKPGRRNGGGGGGGTPGANPGGGIPKGAVKAGGWSAPTTGGPDGWGGTWEKGRGKGLPQERPDDSLSRWGSLPLSSSTRTAQRPQIPLQQGGTCTTDLISSLGNH